MNEEIIAELLPDGKTFRCVKSQLMKTNGKSPVTGRQLIPPTQ